MMKRCSRCKKMLPGTEFNWKFKGVRLSCYCKKCSREYIKDHYNRNREYYLEKAKRRNLQVKLKYFGYIRTYLKSHPCIDCGESDILVLEFDHKDRDLKDVDISSLVRRMLSFKKLLSEISKCEVRCANCHRRKTLKENNSWRIDCAPVA